MINMQGSICYILDYSDGTINKIILTDDDESLIDNSVECFLYKHGFNDSNCAWIFSDNNYEITKNDKNNE